MVEQAETQLRVVVQIEEEEEEEDIHIHIHIYCLYNTKPVYNIGHYFVSKLLYDCIIFFIMI
jgi:hypothetical protein